MPAVRKQQFPSACEKIIFSFSDSLLNGNFGEYVFMACEQPGLDFTPEQQKVVIIAAHCLCVPGFHFHSWKKVVGFIRPPLPNCIDTLGWCCITCFAVVWNKGTNISCIRKDCMHAGVLTVQVFFSVCIFSFSLFFFWVLQRQMFLQYPHTRSPGAKLHHLTFTVIDQKY